MHVLIGKIQLLFTLIREVGKFRPQSLRFTRSVFQYNVTVEPTGKASFVYNYIQTRLTIITIENDPLVSSGSRPLSTARGNIILAIKMATDLGLLGQSSNTILQLSLLAKLLLFTTAFRRG